MDKNTFPTFEQYFAEREEAFYKDHPEFKDHPELDIVDGISGKYYRKQQAQLHYDAELMVHTDRIASAEKEAQALKNEYERKVKGIYESKGIEQSNIDKAYLKMFDEINKKGEKRNKELNALMRAMAE